MEEGQGCREGFEASIANEEVKGRREAEREGQEEGQGEHALFPCNVECEWEVEEDLGEGRDVSDEAKETRDQRRHLVSV